MKIIILPGYSLHNREWVEEVKQSLASSAGKKKLDDKHEVFVHPWKHWETGEQRDFSVKDESEKVLSEIGTSKVNIIAKSVGTLVAATLVKRIIPQLEKLILCGIPTAFIRDNDLENKAYLNLKKLNPQKILVIQNNKDPLASYDQIKEMFLKINPQIKVLRKDREDHNYPYFTDFEDFLLN